MISELTCVGSDSCHGLQHPEQKSLKTLFSVSDGGFDRCFSIVGEKIISGTKQVFTRRHDKWVRSFQQKTQTSSPNKKGFVAGLRAKRGRGFVTVDLQKEIPVHVT